MDREVLKRELKELVVVECQKNHIQPDQIADDDILIGSAGRLDLDSLDALQIALAVKQRYGKRIDGGKDTRQALKSINSLADFILAD
ncbi:MAG TPA: acyl carrier protein [Gammaproteobacteria bacterium]|nr:acyl carrier protein [Gammaproteobacteria bacterium]